LFLAFVKFGQLSSLQARVINAINDGFPNRSNSSLFLNSASIFTSGSHQFKLTEIKAPSSCGYCAAIIFAQT